MMVTGCPFRNTMHSEGTRVAKPLRILEAWSSCEATEWIKTMKHGPTKLCYLIESEHARDDNHNQQRNAQNQVVDIRGRFAEWSPRDEGEECCNPQNWCKPREKCKDEFCPDWPVFGRIWNVGAVMNQSRMSRGILQTMSDAKWKCKWGKDENDKKEEEKYLELKCIASFPASVQW